MAVRRPAAQYDAENSQCADTYDEKNANVDVLRDLKRGSDRQASQRKQRRAHGEHRCKPENEFVSVVRDDVFFDEQFYCVGDGLEKSVRPHAHRPQPRLHVRHELAFHQHDVADDQRQNGDDSHSRKQRRPEGFQELDGCLNNGIHYRSTSPSTISIVPMIATTSATRCPRTMRSNACKLMNEGGRMCTRYGMTVPSLTT